MVDGLGTLLTDSLYGALDSSFTGAIANKFGPVKDALTQQGGRLIQPRISGALQTDRAALRRELVPAGGTQLPIRSAAAWVDDEYNAGTQQLVH